MLFNCALQYLLLFWVPVYGHVIDFGRLQYRSLVNTSTIVYQLFTRKNPDEPQIIKLADRDLIEFSNYDPSLPTKIFAHGWNSDPTTCYSIKNEYLKREDCNFIAVDWSHLAAGLYYPRIVTHNVPATASHIGKFLDFLVEVTGATIETFHLMGHSLGAHAVGEASAVIKSGRIPRITGLDPAGPLFTIDNSESRLDKSNAKFVDVIHTNSGSLLSGKLSILPPIGHADFYPNGGQYQPGCSTNNVEVSVNARSVCDHNRAIAYYAESINSKVGFRAIQCDDEDKFFAGSCAYNEQVFMGYSTPSSTRGVFYLETNSRAPYAKG